MAQKYDSEFFAVAIREAADSIRRFSMTYGARSVPFFATLDCLSLLYGMCYRASYIEVYRTGKGSSKWVTQPLWSTRCQLDRTYAPPKAKRPSHRVVLETTDGRKFCIAAFLLDDDDVAQRGIVRVDEESDLGKHWNRVKNLGRDFHEAPNLLAALFSSRGVAEAFLSAVLDLKAKKPGRPHSAVLQTDPKLYKILDIRVGYAIQSQGEHVHLGVAVHDDAKGLTAKFMIAHRMSVPRFVRNSDVKGAPMAEIPYTYRFILSPKQRDLLQLHEIESLTYLPRQKDSYRSRIDSAFLSESVATNVRIVDEAGPRCFGKMCPDRESGLKSFRRLVRIDREVFQVYVPIHISGRVAFVVPFHLPFSMRQDAFSVYSNFIPALAASLRQSVFETAAQHARTDREFESNLDMLCGDVRDRHKHILVRDEGKRSFRELIKVR